MKVGTDSMLLGSWCEPESATQILDIGCGTGLLSLMMAQKSEDNCQITALELDEPATQQALENVAASPWPDKIQVIHADFTSWQRTTKQHFSLIISNPPWFEFTPSAAHNADNQQRDKARTAARQQQSLPLASLFTGVANLLTDSGRFYFVLPSGAEKTVMGLIKEQCMQLVAIVNVKATPEKAPYCQLWCLKKNSGAGSAIDYLMDKPVSELIVRENEGVYSDAFKTLCQPFYLNF